MLIFKSIVPSKFYRFSKCHIPLVISVPLIVKKMLFIEAEIVLEEIWLQIRMAIKWSEWNLDTLFM